MREEAKPHKTQRRAQQQLGAPANSISYSQSGLRHINHARCSASTIFDFQDSLNSVRKATISIATHRKTKAIVSHSKQTTAGAVNRCFLTSFEPTAPRLLAPTTGGIFHPFLATSAARA
jgi:hypothetical protein